MTAATPKVQAIQYSWIRAEALKSELRELSLQHIPVARGDLHATVICVMTQHNEALKVALAAAQQLSPKLQKQLAEQLLLATEENGDTAVVYLQRLSPRKQDRLSTLMDKNSEGQLSRAERTELKRLGSEADHILLENSLALTRALRPELFGKQGKPIPSRLRQALRRLPPRHLEIDQEHAQG